MCVARGRVGVGARVVLQHKARGRGEGLSHGLQIKIRLKFYVHSLRVPTYHRHTDGCSCDHYAWLTHYFLGFVHHLHFLFGVAII